MGVRTLVKGDNCEKPKLATEVTSTPTKAPKPFSQELLNNLAALALSTGLSTIALVKKAPESQWVSPIRSTFMLTTTLSLFVFGANLPKSFTKLVHPLVTCTGMTWLASKALAAFTGSTFMSVLSVFKVHRIEIPYFLIE